MSYKKQLAVAMCLVLGGTIMGCPLAGPLVLGPYKIYFDDNCDDQDDSVDALFLYGDGSLEYVADGGVKTGQWSVDGAIFTMTIFDFSGDNDLSGQATIDTNALVEGTYSVPGIVTEEGCFRAVRALFQQ
ncbi:MAG: hypothetical protein AMXMBFR84_15960 [Candidatus Hydrogenedentota bacterium]